VRTTDVGQPAPITPIPKLPVGSPAVTTLLEDLVPFYDDGTEGLAHLVARLPHLLDVQRAYIGRLSADGRRFAVTQTSQGDWPDLLGHTQSVARLPAFARGALKTGIQGMIEDAPHFPFTPQQRKMLSYVQLGATVFTPIPTAGGVAGALVLDQLSAPRTWDPTILETCKLIAEAIGARIALAQSGDHLVVEDVPAGREATRINVLANIARLNERSDDTGVAMEELGALLEGLPWVEAVRVLRATDQSNVLRDAMASERIVARAVGSKTMLGIPMVLEGEKFGGFEVLLGERLTDLDEQFWRSVQTFAGTMYASALRRGRPRDESLRDGLTGLLNFRSINEALAEAVQAAKSSGRRVSAWIVDIEGLDAINRSQGYAIGDDVVSYVGHTLGSVAASFGTVGRIGGGMFLVVFPNMDEEETSIQARMTLERITKNTPGHLPTIGLTIGVSGYPTQATGHDDLIRSTRLALYAAKNRGAGTVAVARAKDETWMREARAAFVRIMSDHQMPAALTQIRK
jgi:diguanylate cyclase (GGDEF)-like protein